MRRAARWLDRAVGGIILRLRWLPSDCRSVSVGLVAINFPEAADCRSAGS